MSAAIRWVIAMVTVVVLLVAGLFLGLLMMMGGAVGETEVILAAEEDVCSGISPGLPGVPGEVFHPMTGPYTVRYDYGVRINPISKVRDMHTGIDMGHTELGLGVVAALDGVVTSAGMTPGGGNTVTIDHGGGRSTRYLHLDRLDVQTGHSVTGGEQVGIEGNTGYSSGPHLHFEVLSDGVPIDPRPWLVSQGYVLPGAGTRVVAPTPPRPSPPGDAPVLPPIVGGGAQADAGGGSLARGVPAALRTVPGPDTVEVPGYDAEQLRNAGHIIAAGQALDLGQWEITVAVMTALGESSLYNIDHGDVAGPDSRGLFQQRDNGAWGSEEDRMNPTIASTNFYRALIAVPGYAELAPTIAANRVQGNADPFYYVPFWPDAGRIVAAITDDDDFLRGLPPAGDLPPDGCIPPGGTTPGPIGECPATGSPAEPGLSEPTLYMMRCTFEAYPVPTMYGIGDRSLPSSDHPRGYAVDFALADYRSPEGNAYGWELSHWAVEHAQELELKYVIFDMKIWYPDSGWEPYTVYGPDPDDSLAHRDHVHISVSG